MSTHTGTTDSDADTTPPPDTDPTARREGEDDDAYRRRTGREVTDAAGKGDTGKADGDDADADRTAKREAQRLRARLREVETERDTLKRERETEAERREREAREGQDKAGKLEARLREVETGVVVRDLAGALGIIDAKAAHRLMDTDGLEYGDDGRPDEGKVKDALKAAIKAHPFLTRGGDADTGTRREASSGKGQMNDWLRGSR